MVDAPHGWYQGPDGKWYPGPGSKTDGLSFPDISSWSRGKKLRVGLIVIGIAEIVSAIGSLIYTISISSRIISYPGSATFGSIVTELSAMVMGAALIWIARQYVQE